MQPLRLIYTLIEDGDNLYTRVLRVFWVLQAFWVLWPLNIWRHQSLSSSAILMGLVFCQSCEFCTILKMVEVEDILVVEEDITVNFHLYPSPLVSFLCSSCSKVLPTKENFLNHIKEMHKTQHDASSVTRIFHARSYLSGTAPCMFYHPSPIGLVKSLWEGRQSIEELGYLPQ